MPGAAGPPPCDPRDSRSRDVKYGNGAGHASSSPETGFLTATGSTNFGPSYTMAFIAFVLAMGCSSVIYRCASPQQFVCVLSRIIVDRPWAAGRYGGASEATGGAGVGGKPLFAPAAASTWLERLMATYERRIWVGVLASTPVERFPSFENLDHHCNPAKALTHPSQHFCARR